MLGIIATFLAFQNEQQPQISGAALGAFIAAYGLFVLVAIVLGIVIYWRIFSKAGWSGWWSLVMVFIPLVNLIVILIFAFSEWPIERRLRAAEAAARRTPMPTS